MCTRRDDTHNQNHQRLVQRTGQAQGRQGLVLLECRRYGHRARIADAVPCVRAARDDADSITALGVLAAYLEDGHVDTPFGSRIVHPAAVVELAGLCAHGVLG